MDNKNNEGIVDPDELENHYLKNQLVLVKTMKSGKIIFMKFLGELNISQFEKVRLLNYFKIKNFIVSVLGDQHLPRNRQYSCQFCEEKSRKLIIKKVYNLAFLIRNLKKKKKKN